MNTTPISWKAARSDPAGKVQDSFKAAAKSWNLITDDNIAELTLREAAIEFEVTAFHLRQLFLAMLRFDECSKVDAPDLLEKFFDRLTLDYNGDHAAKRSQLYHDLNANLETHNAKLSSFLGPDCMPAEVRNINREVDNMRSRYSPDIEKAEADRLLAILSDEQRHIYDQVLHIYSLACFFCSRTTPLCLTDHACIGGQEALLARY